MSQHNEGIVWIRSGVPYANTSVVPLPEDNSINAWCLLCQWNITHCFVKYWVHFLSKLWRVWTFHLKKIGPFFFSAGYEVWWSSSMGNWTFSFHSRGGAFKQLCSRWWERWTASISTRFVVEGAIVRPAYCKCIPSRWGAKWLLPS